MDDPTKLVNPLGVFTASFVVAALAGIAALLRSGKPPSLLSIFSAALNSGLMGLCISLLWYVKFQENLYFLVGICVLAGLGGATTIDYVLDVIKKGGFNISVGPKGDASVPGLNVETKKDDGSAEPHA